MSEEKPEYVETTPFEEKDMISKSVSDIAQEVKAGLWGTGQDRRQRLSDAGYDAREVEKEVVRLSNPL